MPLSCATSICPWRSDCSVLTGGTTTSSTCLISAGVRPLRDRYVLMHRLGVRAEGVHADLLADQVARRPDRAAVEHEVAGSTCSLEP